MNNINLGRVLSLIICLEVEMAHSFKGVLYMCRPNVETLTRHVVNTIAGGFKEPPNATTVPTRRSNGRLNKLILLKFQKQVPLVYRYGPGLGLLYHGIPSPVLVLTCMNPLHGCARHGWAHTSKVISPEAESFYELSANYTYVRHTQSRGNY